jgi:2-C-methyl-D-erythritol 4-phosphate cytidylyltransferase
MGAEMPKQYLEIAGRPVLMHTLERFKSFSESIEIIAVLPENQLRFWAELQSKYSFNVPHTLVKGGKARFFSVRNGLKFVEEPGLVAIHDGVRPFVSIDTIKRCFETAEKLGNAIPVIPPSDTLRMISDQGSTPVNRLLVRQVQTPQVFNSSIIKKAYHIKITTPEDLIISAALLPIVS